MGEIESGCAYCSVCGKTRVVEIPKPTKKNPERKIPKCVNSLIAWKGSKYRNVPTTTSDGCSFHSKKEAKRWEQLKDMERKGEIYELRKQVPFRLVVGNRKTTYRADFTYKTTGGEYVVEDVKGVRFGTAYSLFKTKAMLVELLYGINVKEV